MKDDGDLVAPKQGIHFDQEINRIFRHINSLPCNDSDEELGIIHQFIREKIML